MVGMRCDDAKCDEKVCKEGEIEGAVVKVIEEVSVEVEQRRDRTTESKSSHRVD